MPLPAQLGGKGVNEFEPQAGAVPIIIGKRGPLVFYGQYNKVIVVFYAYVYGSVCTMFDSVHAELCKNEAHRKGSFAGKIHGIDIQCNMLVVISHTVANELNELTGLTCKRHQVELCTAVQAFVNK